LRAGANWGWYCVQVTTLPTRVRSGTFNLGWQVGAAPVERPVTAALPNFSTPSTDAAVQTLVVVHTGRAIDSISYPGDDASPANVRLPPSGRAGAGPEYPAGMDAVYSRFAVIPTVAAANYGRHGRG